MALPANASISIQTANLHKNPQTNNLSFVVFNSKIKLHQFNIVLIYLHMSEIRPKFATTDRLLSSRAMLVLIKTTIMKTTQIPLFTSVILLILGFSNVRAQTCRVAVGLSSDGVQTFKEVIEYDLVEVKPSFPGGNEPFLDYINQKRQYPSDAYAQGIEGRVTCSFVVNADGNISHIRVIKGCHKSLNLEAMRLLAEMPSWQPGRHSTQCVPVRVVHSIPFRK